MDFIKKSLIEYKDDEASLKKDALRADEIKLVMENVNVSHNTAITVLKETNGDIVEAILKLS